MSGELKSVGLMSGGLKSYDPKMQARAGPLCVCLAIGNSQTSKGR